ncbi:MAG: iron ABC transporter permease [Steroidobacteraceae bacterium]
MFHLHPRRLLATLAALALLALALALLCGPSELAWRDAMAGLFGRDPDGAGALMRAVRLPRALAAFGVGAMLSLAGVLLQALFRNPLADPFVLGVSGGAAVGALSALSLGMSLMGQQLGALAGAVVAGIAALWLGRGGGALRLLLVGVIIASGCGAILTLLLSLADQGQLRGMVFWLAGDLDWADHPLLDLLAAAAALIVALRFARALNVLAAGELRAASVGLDGDGARRIVFLCAAALSAIAVLSAGTIGFVGLVAPHLARLLFGSSDHRWVAPGAVLLGGALLCVADTLSRVLAAPRQLPVGAVMALLGAPLFISLLRRNGQPAGVSG